MSYDKRERVRYNPDGLLAHIVIDTTLGKEIIKDGKVIDISYSGIKIQLNEPITDIIYQAKIRISLTLPQSQVAVNIHGNIKHIHNHNQLGLQYTDSHSEQTLDNLLFECIKLVPQHSDYSDSVLNSDYDSKPA